MISDKDWEALEPFIDVELRDLVYVLNQLPGIKTLECCSGHGKGACHVFFEVAEGEHEGLFYLARSVDLRYFEYGHDWSLQVTVADMPSDPLPITFILERSPAPVVRIKEEVEALIENISSHLNDKEFNLLYGLSRPFVRRLAHKHGWHVKDEPITFIHDERQGWGPATEQSFRLRYAPLCSPEHGPFSVTVAETTREGVVVQSYTAKSYAGSLGHFAGTTGTVDYLTGEVKGFRFQKPGTPGNFVTASYWYRSAPAPHG